MNSTGPSERSSLLRYNAGKGLRRRMSQLAYGEAASDFTRILPETSPAWSSLSQVEAIKAAKDKASSKALRYYRQQYELSTFYHDAAEYDDLRKAGEDAVGDVLFPQRLSFYVNVALFLMKIVAFVFSFSLAVFGSTLESALDILSLGIFAWAAKQESKPEPFKFPIGKSNIEVVANVGFAALMGGAALVVMSQGIQALATGLADGTTTSEASIGLVPLLLIGVAVLAKMGLYAVCSTYSSRSMAAAALAQDHWNDCFSTAFTLVAILLVSFLPSLWWIDATAAVVMSLIIIRTWWGAAQDHTELLLGRWAPPAQHSKVLAVALLHDERIEAIEHLNAYTYGERTQVELDIVLPPDMPNCTAHDIAEGLQFKIESLPFVARAYVHIDWRIPLGDSPGGIPEHITPFLRKQFLQSTLDTVRTQETPAMSTPAAESAFIGIQSTTDESPAIHLEVLSEGGPQTDPDSPHMDASDGASVTTPMPSAHPVAHKAASEIIHRHSSLQFTRMRVGGQQLNLGSGGTGTGIGIDTSVPPSAQAGSAALFIQQSISTPHGALDQLTLAERFAGFENIHPDVLDGEKLRAAKAAAHKTARRTKRHNLLAEQDRVLRHVVLRDGAGSVGSPGAMSVPGPSDPAAGVIEPAGGRHGKIAARIPAALVPHNTTQQLVFPGRSPAAAGRSRFASAGDAGKEFAGSQGAAQECKPVPGSGDVRIAVGTLSTEARQQEEDSSSDEDESSTAHIRLGAAALPATREPRQGKPSKQGGFCAACCSIADTQSVRTHDL